MSYTEQQEPEKAVVVLSGGQDSTTCLFWALNQGYDVHTVTFDYGQRHSIELEAARNVANRANIPEEKRELITLGPILKSTSPLVSDEELELYCDHTCLPGGLEKTFVPMRNQLFLTIAANRAYHLGARFLVTGVCQEDSGGYPDCRQDFITSFENTCNRGTFTGEEGALDYLTVHTPLMNLTKADAVKLAYNLPGCYAALAWTHTAYDGQFPPIGHDHATLLREKGFEEAGLPDPLVLRAFHMGLMDLPDSDNYDSQSVSTVMPMLEMGLWLEKI